MSAQKHALLLSCFQIDTISMKRKSNPKEKSSLDRIMEDNADKKNAWIKIILELEKAENLRKGSKNT